MTNFRLIAYFARDFLVFDFSKATIKTYTCITIIFVNNLKNILKLQMPISII